MRVCSTSHVYHYFFNPSDDMLESLKANGLRPLSYFPDSERWKQIQEHQADFFEQLYKMLAEPIIQKPYVNSGIFVTPIDFRKLPNTYLHDKPRLEIPVDVIDAAWSAITYVNDNQRIALPYHTGHLEQIAQIWDEDKVRTWFAKDQTKVFFYVPQIVTYQPDGIPFELTAYNTN